jgi:predicted HicB family RNase H-like nuclease|tara:strand:+ start:515 stop:673 length:159 start_codon:yes stop_codon:yes gene_type:complete
MNINYQIPDDLHSRLKIEAARRGITLKALIIDVLSKGLELSTWQPEQQGAQQ